MKALIEERLSELAKEKSEILVQYPFEEDPELKETLAAINMRISMEMKFLEKLVAVHDEQLKNKKVEIDKT